MMHGTHNVTLTHCNMMHGTHNVTLTNCNMMHCTHSVTLTHCNMMHGTYNVKSINGIVSGFTCSNLNGTSVAMVGMRTETLTLNISSTSMYRQVCGCLLEGYRRCRLPVELRKNTCRQTCMVDVRTRKFPNHATCVLVYSNSMFLILKFCRH